MVEGTRLCPIPLALQSARAHTHTCTHTHTHSTTTHQTSGQRPNEGLCAHHRTHAAYKRTTHHIRHNITPTRHYIVAYTRHNTYTHARPPPSPTKLQAGVLNKGLHEQTGRWPSQRTHPWTRAPQSSAPQSSAQARGQVDEMLNVAHACSGGECAHIYRTIPAPPHWGLSCALCCTRSGGIPSDLI